MNQVCGRRGGGGGGDHKNGPSFPHTCPTFTTFGQQLLYLEITFAHSVHLVGKGGFGQKVTRPHTCPSTKLGWPPHVIRKVGPGNLHQHLVATSI